LGGTAAWKFIQAIRQRDMNDERVGSACVPFHIHAGNGVRSRYSD
jgi:hypothetical protein